MNVFVRKNVVDEIDDEDTDITVAVSYTHLMKLLNEHKAGTAHNMKKIWSVYSFILWYEKYFIEN